MDAIGAAKAAPTSRLSAAQPVVAAAVEVPRRNSVYSHLREPAGPLPVIEGAAFNTRNHMDGLTLLGHVPANSVPLVFFDPQYRSVLNRQVYGNEGESRGRKRSALPQMEADSIRLFISEIVRVLVPTGHLMLWVDKYILCTGVHELTAGSGLQIVDMVTWDKLRMGMGYRTRRQSEHLVILQLPPLRAKDVWQVHDIPDVWPERVPTEPGGHTHAKPPQLQQRLIEAVTSPGGLVVDPAAGGYSVLNAAVAAERVFLGCDILG